MINFFGDGETTLVTKTGKIIKGLKPIPLDKNVYRLHHQWNKFPGNDRLRAISISILGVARWTGRVDARGRWIYLG
eukprot:3245702-Amphidinium_carterae.1